MKITFIGKGIKITNPMRNIITEKLSRCDKYLNKNTEIRVLVRTVKDEQIIEVTIPMEGKKIMRAEERSNNLYEAIDMVEDTITRRLRKTKEKELGNKRHKRVREEETNDDFFDEYPKIVKHKNFDMMMMNPEEAIEEMKMIGHDFYIFKDIKTGATSIVYKRKDKNYGLLSETLN